MSDGQAGILRNLAPTPSSELNEAVPAFNSKPQFPTAEAIMARVVHQNYNPKVHQDPFGYLKPDPALFRPVLWSAELEGRFWNVLGENPNQQ